MDSRAVYLCLASLIGLVVQTLSNQSQMFRPGVIFIDTLGLFRSQALRDAEVTT